MNKLDELEGLRNRVLCCYHCGLCKTRSNIVFGVGNLDAKIMLVGESPGKDEDEQGIPFVGRAGQRLNKFISEAGLVREDLYIANILKCRPPDNRAPEGHEMSVCSKFLDEQIDIIEPEVIIALGATAVKKFLNDRYVKITQIRGNWYEYRGIKLMPTFHPAFILRQSSKENVDKVRQDFGTVVESLGNY